MCVFILYFKALDRKGVCKVFFFLTIFYLLVFDNWHTIYRVQWEKKKELNPSKLSTCSLHRHKPCFWRDACTAAGCVCVCAHSGACRVVRVGGCLLTRAESHVLSGDQILKSPPWQDNARGHPHWLPAQRLKDSGLASASHSLGICCLLGIPLAPRRKCPIFTFYIRTQERVLSPPPFSSHPRHRAQTKENLCPGPSQQHEQWDRGWMWRVPSTPGPRTPCPCSQHPLGPWGTKRQQIALTHQ